MKLYYTLRNNLSLLVVPAILFALASCSSYQYSGYKADGIYGESRPGIWEQENTQNNEVKPNNNSSYYKNLFAQQSEMVGEVLKSDFFTDVDSYSSNDGYENYSEVGGDVAYVGGNAPWGEDPDSYTINIYNNGFYGGYYSPWRYGYAYGGYPYYGGWYDPYWGPYGPYAYGYGGSRWSIGFGYGYGYGGYYDPYYNPYYYNRNPYYNHHYYNDNVAYNRGRRNSAISYRDDNSDRSSYSRRIREIRNSTYSDNGTSNTRRDVNRENAARIYSRSSSRTEPERSYNASRNRSSSPVYQQRSSSRSRSYDSSPSRRSSNSRSTTTRSSSSSRSSGSTTRSSGSSGRGGSRGGGR